MSISHSNISPEVLQRWQSRALRAEMKLFRAGLSSHSPADMWPDDEWLVITLERKDGSAPHIDEVIAARERIAAKKGNHA